MVDGDVRFRAIDGEDIHEAVNVGDTPWRNIIVELKHDKGRRPGATG